MANEQSRPCGGPCGWIRLFGMSFFLVAFVLALPVFLLVTALQIVVVFFTGFPARPFKMWGEGLAIYIHQVISYLSAYSEKAPFPFDAFPRAPEPEDGAGATCLIPAKTPPKTQPSAKPAGR